MKRIFLSLIAATVALSALAQNKKAPEKEFIFEIGPAVAHPIHYLNMFSTIGVGLDGAVTHPFGNGLSVGIRVNYLYFFGRSADPFFTGGGSHYKHSNLYDGFAEANYQFENNIVVGVDLGFGTITFNGNSDPSFAQKAYAGYKWDQGGHPIIFAAFYEQTDYHKNAGVRATVQF